MKRTSMIALAAALTAGPAFADNHMSGDGMASEGVMSGQVTQSEMQNMIYGDEIDGSDIYTLSQEYDPDLWGETDMFDAVEAEWNEIGEISDIVLSQDGKLVGLVAEVGGFLDIGDADVLIHIDDLKFVDDGGDDYTFVTRLTEEQMENLPSVQDTWW